MYIIAIMTLILHAEYNMIRSPLYQKAHLTSHCTSNTTLLIFHVLFVESGMADSRLLYAKLVSSFAFPRPAQLLYRNTKEGTSLFCMDIHEVHN